MTGGVTVAESERTLAALRNGRPPADPLEVHTLAQLEDRPRPSWQVDQLLQARACNVLIGAPGDGKSLMAFGWALSIAAGVDWNGYAVEGGHVLYASPEGVEDMFPRAEAWREHNGLFSLPERMHVIADLIDLLDDGDVRRLLGAIDTLPEPPALIVVDTLARAMPGGEENSAKDVGQLIYAVDLARRHNRGDDNQPAASLILHHSTADGRKERGSTALRGAADNMLSLKLGDDGIHVTRVKLKAGAPGGPWDFNIRPVGDSAVIARDTNSATIGRNARLILEQLSAAGEGDPLSTTRLMRACDVRDGGHGAMSESTFLRAMTKLRQGGYATFESDGRGTKNWATTAGRLLVSQTVNHRHDGGPTTATNMGAPVGRHGDSGRQGDAR